MNAVGLPLCDADLPLVACGDGGVGSSLLSSSSFPSSPSTSSLLVVVEAGAARPRGGVDDDGGDELALGCTLAGGAAIPLTAGVAVAEFCGRLGVVFVQR